jgi:hypothetical protein
MQPSDILRKPYTRPAIVHELLLETHAQTEMSKALINDPGAVDPELPPKPGARPQGSGNDGRVDPLLPPKPAPRLSGSDGGGGGGGGGRSDPPLPPKPPKP